MVVALAIFTFAILAVFGLLPIGIKSNKVSTEEARAADLLTLLEADLRNTSPALASGTSRFFGLPLPYKIVSGTVGFNTTLSVNTLNTTGLKEDDTVVSVGTNPPPRYQLSVVYTHLPSAGGLDPIRARLMVSWPAVTATNASQLTSASNVAGYVETYATFPAP